MRKTTNYGLSLYETTDKMSITSSENSLNANMELIDEVLETKLPSETFASFTEVVANELNKKATIDDMTTYIEEHKDELKGVDGSKGADGYTPVKGTDYWTEEDKTEMKEYIKEEVNPLSEEIDALSNYVTPQMFGAKADGTTDDTVAIQSAINSGEEVFFPKGNYKITSTIVIPYNCEIKGTKDSIIIGNKNIDGFTISTDEVFIENITITDCNNAINLNGNKNIFSRVHLKKSTVGCYINSARSWGNNFNDCRFEYNDIGIESTIIYTSSFTDCKIAFNTNFGIKANLKFVKFEGGYIEANGADWDSTNKIYVERAGTAGIYLPDDSSNPSNSVYFIGVDFENNGEASIRHDNSGGASDFVFFGSQFVVSDHDNVRAALWINVYGHCIKWTFYGTKFPEGTNTINRQIAGKENADENDSTRKPTRFTTNRTWNSKNVNILQYATIDGNYQGYDTDYVTKAEKEKWNAKPTTAQMNTAIANAIGEGVTMSAVNEAIDTAIFGAIEGEY